MGRVHLIVARAGWWLGCAIVSVGALLVAGPGWALIVAGVLIAGSFLLLYDVDTERNPGESPAGVPPPL